MIGLMFLVFQLLSENHDHHKTPLEELGGGYQSDSVLGGKVVWKQGTGSLQEHPSRGSFPIG